MKLTFSMLHDDAPASEPVGIHVHEFAIAGLKKMQPPQWLKQPQKMNGPRLQQRAASIATQGRKQDRQTRLDAAYRELLREGVKPTGQRLCSRACCNRAVAQAWLKRTEAVAKTERWSTSTFEKIRGDLH